MTPEQAILLAIEDYQKSINYQKENDNSESLFLYYYKKYLESINTQNGLCFYFKELIKAGKLSYSDYDIIEDEIEKEFGNYPITYLFPTPIGCLTTDMIIQSLENILKVLKSWL